MFNDKKTLIFDFDGTLVDSMPKWAGIMLQVLKENNIVYPNDIIKTITPLGYSGTAEYYVTHLGLKKSINEIVSRMHELAIYEYSNNISAKDTVKDTLNILKVNGYSLNVLTASPHPSLDPCLKRNCLYDLFDNVWTCEDFGMTKSDVRIYHCAANMLGTSTDKCVFFDDNYNAVSTAKKAGMTVVGVYDDSSFEYTSDMLEICDKYIYKLSEILCISND